MEFKGSRKAVVFKPKDHLYNGRDRKNQGINQCKGLKISMDRL
jgi:hypothetical protein